MTGVGNPEVLQFDPDVFKEVQGLVGEFSVDAICDNKGENSLCSAFYCEDNSVLRANLAGENVWCCPPFK